MSDLKIEDKIPELHYLPENWQQAAIENESFQPVEDTKLGNKGIFNTKDSITEAIPTYLEELEQLDEIQRTAFFNTRKSSFAEFQNSMEEFVTELEEARKETGLPFEKILDEILKVQTEIREDGLENAKLQIKNSQKELRKLHEKRIQRIREALERAKKTDFWSHFEKGANVVCSLAGITTGVAAIAGSGGTAAVIAGCFLVGESIDNLFNDPAKKGIIQLATHLIPMEQEQKKQVNEISLSALKIGVALCTIVGAYKYIPTAVSEASKLGKALSNIEQVAGFVSMGAQAIGLKYEWEGQREGGRLANDTFQSKEKTKKVKKDMKGLESLVTEINTLLVERKKLQESSKSLATHILRGMGVA